MGQAFLAELAIGLYTDTDSHCVYPDYGAASEPGTKASTALMEGGQAIEQLWLFIVAHFVGAAFTWCGNSFVLNE